MSRFARTTAAVSIVGLLVAVWPLISHGVEPLPSTERASVSSNGTQANGDALYAPVITPDGRYVAFTSVASNLVPNDTNNVHDVFVRDRFTGLTERVSMSSNGSQGDGDSAFPSLSADGRFVGFHSLATNLVAGDSNLVNDVFVHDRLTGATERVSVRSDGAQGNGHSVDAQLSADGRFVAFFSASTTFVTGDTPLHDVFVRDRLVGVTERVSVRAAGHVDRLTRPPFTGDGDSFSPAMSADGRYVTFHSGASNLVEDDVGGWSDIFVHDRHGDVTRRITVALDGTEANGDSAHPAISADGRYVTYHSAASNLATLAPDLNNRVDVLVYDQVTGVTTTVSGAEPSLHGLGPPSDGDSFFPAINAQGTFVAFFSSATNLGYLGDQNGGVFDVFVHDRNAGVTWLASRSTSGAWGNDESFHPALAADMNVVAFMSSATNLVGGDTNTWDDVFVRERVGLPQLPGPPTTLPEVTTTTTSVPNPPPSCLPPDVLDTTIADVFGCAGQPPPPVPPCAFFDPVNTSPREILDCYLP